MVVFHCSGTIHLKLVVVFEPVKAVSSAFFAKVLVMEDALQFDRDLQLAMEVGHNGLISELENLLNSLMVKQPVLLFYLHELDLSIHFQTN